MRVTPGVLKKFLETVYTGEMEQFESGEWMLPSIHNPKKMKLAVNINKAVGYDFIGGKGYTAIELIQHLGNFETIQEAQKWVSSFVLKNISTLDMGEFTKTQKRGKEKPPITSRIGLPENLVPIFDQHPYAEFARKYMYSRGFNDQDFDKFHLSVCVAGNFAHRIIIPFIENNEIVFYQGRALNPKADLRYLSPAGIAVSVLVFNIDNIKDHAVLCEGPLDAMTVENGVAIMGSAASEWQVSKLLTKKISSLTVIPDNDKPKIYNGKKVSVGYVGALKTIERFVKASFPIKSIYLAIPDGGKDLNALGKEKAKALVDSAKPFSFSDLITFKQKGAESKLLQRLL